MEKLVWIAAGGAVGSVCRFLVSSWGNQGSVLPWGTFAVNVGGCLLIGILGSYFFNHPAVSEAHRLGLITGFLGGFTTFSAFGWEAALLAAKARPGAALVYVLLSNIAGLLAVFLGLRLGQRTL